MGNTIFIKDRCVHVKPLRSRLEAIQRLKVNFVIMFCPELQKLLKPIYDLTKKGKPFHGEKNNRTYFRNNK